MAPTDWATVPLDSASSGAESLGDFRVRQAFSQAVRAGPGAKQCFSSWTWPPGIEVVTAEVELRLRAVEGAYDVEDAVVQSASASDSALERCLVASYRGRRLPVEGAAAGRLHRVVWPLRYYAPER